MKMARIKRRYLGRGVRRSRTNTDSQCGSPGIINKNRYKLLADG